MAYCLSSSCFTTLKQFVHLLHETNSIWSLLKLLWQQFTKVVFWSLTS